MSVNGSGIKNNKGMALLLAVTVVSLLVAITVEFNRNMRQELVSSANLKDSSQLAAIAKSGYNLAAAVLLQDLKDKSTFDSEHDDWKKFNENNLSQLFSKGSLEVDVEDLSGKLQLNSLGKTTGGTGGTGGNSNSPKTEDTLKRLLLSDNFGELSSDEADLIINALIDWVDTNNNENGIDETESTYYLNLNPSYSSKNGPFEHIEELLLVRGISSDIYYGAGGSKGLRDFVTVHGDDGKININTAAPELLVALNPDMTTEEAEKLVSFREDEDNKNLLNNTGWYESVPTFSGDVKFETDAITVSSSYFNISSKALFGDMTRTYTSVVQRDSNNKINMILRKVD